MNKNKQREQEYEAFKREWMAPILNGKPNTSQLGGQFAVKLVESWLDLQEDAPNFTHCDGSGDGGIDAAYWQGTESNADQDGFNGETWYLVQSKYGRAFKGPRTIIEEGNKVIDTLLGNNSNLTSLNQAGLTERLQSFWKNKSNQDRFILVFATDNPLKESHRSALEEVRANGAVHLGNSFQIEEVSLKITRLATY